MTSKEALSENLLDWSLYYILSLLASSVIGAIPKRESKENELLLARLFIFFKIFNLYKSSTPYILFVYNLILLTFYSV